MYVQSLWVLQLYTTKLYLKIPMSDLSILTSRIEFNKGLRKMLGTLNETLYFHLDYKNFSLLL